MDVLAGLGDNSLPGHFSPDPLTGQPVHLGQVFAEFEEEGLFGSEGEQEEDQVSKVNTGQFPAQEAFFAGVPKTNAADVVMTSTDEEAARKREKAARKAARKQEKKAAKAATKALSPKKTTAAKPKAKATTAAAAKPKAKATTAAAAKPKAKATTAATAKAAVKKNTAPRKRPAPASFTETQATEKRPKTGTHEEEEPASGAEQQVLAILRKNFVTKEEHDEAIAASKEGYEAVEGERDLLQTKFDALAAIFK